MSLATGTVSDMAALPSVLQVVCTAVDLMPTMAMTTGCGVSAPMVPPVSVFLFFFCFLHTNLEYITILFIFVLNFFSIDYDKNYFSSYFYFYFLLTGLLGNQSVLQEVASYLGRCQQQHEALVLTQSKAPLHSLAI